MDYIAGLCDESYTDLPAPNNVNFGRASKGAALALKARLRFNAASRSITARATTAATTNSSVTAPTTRNAGSPPPRPAAEVIRLGDYDIYNPNPVAETDRDEQVIASGSANYRKLFTVITGNKELILPRTSKVGNRVEIQNFPVGIPNGKGLTSPSQQMVDAYGTVTGQPIDDPESPYDRKNPYENRDPRFYASIFYNGQNWNGTTIETFRGGAHNNTNTSTRTGYYMSKFCGSEVVISGTPTNTNHCFPLFRYAELLLDYAEAVNEAYGPDVDPLGWRPDGARRTESGAQPRTPPLAERCGCRRRGQRRDARGHPPGAPGRAGLRRPPLLRRETLENSRRSAERKHPGHAITKNGDTFSYQIVENVNSRPVLSQVLPLSDS